MPEPSQLSYSAKELIDASKRHISFLRDLHRLGITTAHVHCHSWTRYATLWLPLVAKNDSENNLIPPPDIAWLWHCHRLAPSHYETYVTKTFGKIVEANPPFC